MNTAGGAPGGDDGGEQAAAHGGWARPRGLPGAGSPRVPGVAMLRLLGAGGHGEVWLADDLASGDRVAVKVRRDPAARLPSLGAAGTDAAAATPADTPADTPDGATQVSTAAARLSREVALLRRIDHPHVVRLRRVVDLPGGARALVMDHAAGGSLADLVAIRGLLDASEAATVLITLARTLADLHERGLVHGDLTPSNVLFGIDGRPMIADLGCAVVLGEATDEAWGSPGYCDPARSGRAGRPDDVYALGAVLRFALTGDPAAEGSRAGDEDTCALLAVADLCTAADPDRRPGLDALIRTVVAAAAPGPVRLVGSCLPPSGSALAAGPTGSGPTGLGPTGSGLTRRPLIVPPAAVRRPLDPAVTAPTVLPPTAVDLPLPAAAARRSPPAVPAGTRGAAARGTAGQTATGRSRSRERASRSRERASRSRERSGPAGGGAARTTRLAVGLVGAIAVGWWFGLPNEPSAVSNGPAASNGPSASNRPMGSNRPMAASAPAASAPAASTDLAAVGAAVVRLAQGRAAAFRSASAELLTGVDEPGSPALDADLAFVRRLRSAGIQLAGLSFTVAQVRISGRGSDGTLVVTARVSTSAHLQKPLGGTAATPVPPSAPRDVVLTLAPAAGGREWLVRAVQ